MAAGLIRWAWRRRADIGILGLLVAVLVIMEEIFQFTPWIEGHAPWIAYDLGLGVRLMHLLGALLAVAAFAVIFYPRVSERNPPPGPLGLLHFLELPKAPDQARFKFRMPQAEADLAPFVKFSDAEAYITYMHPDLFGTTRWELYKDWFRIRRQSFLVLDRHDVKSGAWETIALSIVLPLTSAGVSRLCDGHVRIIEMRDLEIASAGEASSALLIDTWIVKKKAQARQVNKPVREPHKKYGRALLFVHLGVFWDPTAAAAFFVEAANPHIHEICEDLGFDGSRRTKDGQILQQLSYPDNSGNEELTRRLTIIANNVGITRRWPIIGFRA